MNETSKKLASDHWSYIEKLIKNHNEPREIINKCDFHYQTAFIHGFKHGVEWLKEQQKKQNDETMRRSFP